MPFLLLLLRLPGKSRKVVGSFPEIIEQKFKFLQDELLWASVWLYKASGDSNYLNYVLSNQGWSQAVSEFSWDNKFAGAQVLLAEVTSLVDRKHYYRLPKLKRPIISGGNVSTYPAPLIRSSTVARTVWPSSTTTQYHSCVL